MTSRSAGAQPKDGSAPKPAALNVRRGWQAFVGPRGRRYMVPTAQSTPSGLCYRDTGGRGKTLILVHGWTADSLTNWFSAFEPLRAAGWRAVAVDLPGHGGSKLVGGKFRLKRAAAAVLSVADHLDVRTFHIAGYSMGGPVSLLCAREAPKRVRGALLAATAAHIIPSWHNRTALAGLEIVAGAGFEVAATFAGLRSHVNGPGDAEVSLAQHARWMARNSSKSALVRAGGELARFDARSWIDELNLRSVVLVATRDKLVPVAAQRELAERLGATRVEVDAGHTFCLNADFGDVIADAVQSLAPARRKRGA